MSKFQEGETRSLTAVAIYVFTRFYIEPERVVSKALMDWPSPCIPFLYEIISTSNIFINRPVQYQLMVAPYLAVKFLYKPSSKRK